MKSVHKIARTAGLLYLLYVITSFIANLFGKFVFVEAPVTINHILTHATQFRIGFVINLFSVVFFLIAAWALYVLLKLVNKDLALLFLLFNVAGFAVWLFSSLCLFASLMILTGQSAQPCQPDQRGRWLYFLSGYTIAGSDRQVVWSGLTWEPGPDSGLFRRSWETGLGRHLPVRVGLARSSLPDSDHRFPVWFSFIAEFLCLWLPSRREPRHCNPACNRSATAGRITKEG